MILTYIFLNMNHTESNDKLQLLADYYGLNFHDLQVEWELLQNATIFEDLETIYIESITEYAQNHFSEFPLLSSLFNTNINISFYQHQHLTLNEVFQQWIELKRMTEIASVRFWFIACWFLCTARNSNGIGRLWEITLWRKFGSITDHEFTFAWTLHI